MTSFVSVIIRLQVTNVMYIQRDIFPLTGASVVLVGAIARLLSQVVVAGVLNSNLLWKFNSG